MKELSSEHQAGKRAEELQQLLNQYSHSYHVEDEPQVSDAIYDSLFNELKKIEEAYPSVVKPTSPTQRVGGKLKQGFAKVKHRTRMLSLNDVFSLSDIEAWAMRIEKLLPGQDVEYFADIKMDGLACSLVYYDGILERAVTRGDSFIGEDVTSNARTIKNIPLQLRDSAKSNFLLKGRTEIRGEIILPKNSFVEINLEQEKAGLPVYANPRNLAAGTMRQLDPQLVASRPLQFRAYDLLYENPKMVKTNDYAYELLGAAGFTKNAQAGLFKELDALMNFIHHWDKERDSLPYATDGIVIKVNNREQFEQLGVVGKQPRGAVAYKYAPEQATAVVEDIVISIGRSGAATPVAVFEPVQLAGTTIKHAGLHNADEIARLDVRKGDTVVVYKAGDIIPQVDSVVKELRPPHSKPVIFEQLLKEQYPELEFVRPTGQAVYRLKNLDSDLVLKRAIEYYGSRGALNIEGLGEKNVQALVDAGLLKDVADIYTLKKDDVLKLERFGTVSTDKLLQAINESKRPALDRFILALGIRHVGAKTANDLANHFKSLDALENASYEQLVSVEGIGEVVAESVLAWFASEDNLMLLEKFKDVGVQPVYSKSEGKLEGQSFVVTGTLTGMSRDQAATLIKQHGGTFQTGINKNTTYLVVGENVGKTKTEKAERLGVKILTEPQFMQLIN